MWLQFSILEMWLPPWTSHLPHPWNLEEHRPSTPLKDLMFLRAKQLWKRKMSWPSLPESLTTAGGHQHPAFHSGTFQVLRVQGNVWWQPGVWFWKTLWPVDRISGQFRPHNCRRFSKGRPLCPGKDEGNALYKTTTIPSQLCDNRDIPLVFLQNGSKSVGSTCDGVTMKERAKFIHCQSVVSTIKDRMRSPQLFLEI